MFVFIICLWAFILHVCIGLLCYMLVKFNRMKISMHLMALVWFLPFWGFLIAVTADWCNRHHLTASKAISLEQLGLCADDYRTGGPIDEESERTVVPLEEAIVVNDAETRRKMMIDILKQDPKQYISLLQKARFDQDIEVTHYASTAIMEVQRNYELEIQRCEKWMVKQPDDINVLTECINAYKAYIESGLTADSILRVQRLRYREILNKRIASKGADRQIYYDAADNLLELDRANEAKSVLDAAISLWPSDERYYILSIKYYKKINDKEKIKETIENMKTIYLSPVGKEYVAFWSRQY